jgi:DNA mismatch repair protein MutH
VGNVRIILAVIASAVAIAVLIDSPRRELDAQLERDWQEYREHVGGPRVSATSENFPDSLEIRLDTDR